MRSAEIRKSSLKPLPNDSYISTQHIATLLAQRLQAPAKRSQHLNVTDRSIVGRNMLRALSHLVATCCDMLRVETRTSAHAQAQHCCTNLAKRMQHATSKKKSLKFDHFQICQQPPTCRNTSQHGGQTRVTCCAQPSMLRSFGRGLTLKDVRAHYYCTSLVRTLFIRHARATSFSSVRTKSKSQQNIELMAFALTWCANIFVGCLVTPTFFSADHFLL